MKDVKAQVVVLDEEYLPTPSRSFWESLQMIRNYHLSMYPKSVFGVLPLGIGGEYTMRDAFDEIDFYLEGIRLAEDDSLISG